MPGKIPSVPGAVATKLLSQYVPQKSLEMAVIVSVRLSKLPEILNKDDAQTNVRQKPHAVVTHINNNTSGKSKTVTKDAKLQLLLAGSNIITTAAKVDCHRKVNLKDAKIHTITKDRLTKLCNEYMDIFSNNLTGIGKTELVQITLTLKDNIKP